MADLREKKLLAEERRRAIRAMLTQHGRITVEEVVHRFGVSAVTARSDLDALAECGALIRSHGGGTRAVAAIPEHPLLIRQGMYQAEKARIAEAAVQLIRPFETVILCTGSTSSELASQIAQKRLQNVTVITYALNVATRLAGAPDVCLVLLGGLLRQPSAAFVGPHAEQTMQSLHADHCFMSTVGLDIDVGLTTLDIMEAQLNRRMIDSAAQVTVIADSSKFGHRSLSLISDFGSVHRVITDDGAPPAQVDHLRARGINVMVV